jgi:Hemolysins and related proteins containing CBS domains
LVTVEDALEEIVGELTDEHDSAAPEVEELPGGGFRVPARLPIDELGELFDIRMDDDDVDSVGGLLAKLLGRVPLPGASAEVDGIRLEAERVEGRRRRLATVLAFPAPRLDEEPPGDEPLGLLTARSADPDQGA